MQEVKKFVSPTPICLIKAKGRPVVSVPLLLYSDDFSGNRTKKWNCFNVWCLMLAGLPKALHAQRENIHLMSASNKVPVLQMINATVEDLLVLQEGIFMFNAYLQQEVLVIAPVLAVMGDNPRALETARHLTGNPNKFCGQCMVKFVVDKCLLYSYPYTLPLTRYYNVRIIYISISITIYLQCGIII